MTSLQRAAQYVKNKLAPSGEPPRATVARVVIDKKNAVVLDTDSSGNATITPALTLLGAVLWKGGVKLYAGDIATGLTAHAGGGQSSAISLTKTVSIVSTVGTGNDSAKLPAATGSGKLMLVRNTDGSNSMNLYPATGGAIDGGSTNAAVAVASGKQRLVCDTAANAWTTLLYA